MISRARYEAAIILVAALTSGCGSAALEPTETGAAPLSEAQVPDLVCESVVPILRRPDVVSATFSSGVATVHRYSILDGQRYLIGQYDVSAADEIDPQGVHHVVISDQDGKYTLKVDDQGQGTLAFTTVWNTSYTRPVTCAAAPPPP
jgi:hypothetical protein